MNCPYHKRSKATGCKKFSHIGISGSECTLRGLKQWCLQAARVDRQWKHLAFPVDMAAPDEAYLDAELATMPAPPTSTLLKTDVELDAGQKSRGGAAKASAQKAKTSKKKSVKESVTISRAAAPAAPSTGAASSSGVADAAPCSSSDDSPSD